MLLLILGLLLVALRLAGLEPVAHWSWWLVLWPFAGAVVWWQLADRLGWTKQREIKRMADKQVDRRNKAIAALGLDPRQAKRNAAARAKQQAQQPQVTADSGPIPMAGSPTASGLLHGPRDSSRREPRL